jgi:hypothetical protein
MPRFARLYAPGESFHVISRFVNSEFRIPSDEVRQRYLDCLSRALDVTDWGLLAYGVMSSHTHHAAEQGSDALDALLRSAHTAFADYANKREDRHGPVFSNRAKSILARGVWIGRTIAYIHNNPVRAGIVSDAAQSTWTSHRAYLGLAPRPRWLRVERGLELAGFDDTTGGRRAFHEFVVEESKKSRAEQRAALDGERVRRHLRRALDAPVELESPILDGDRVEFGIRAVRGARARSRPPRWGGSLEGLRAFAASILGIDTERANVREVSRVHALALRAACIELGRPVAEVAGALRIAGSTASGLLREERRASRYASEAVVIAEVLRGKSNP